MPAERSRSGLEVDADLVAAVAYCRLGTHRPADDRAFYRAEQSGLLAQDPTWRATERGEGVLIAVGLLEGQPTPNQLNVHALWARNELYPQPQFVGAWNDGFVECWSSAYEQEREELEQRWRELGDMNENGWEFWTTVEQLAPSWEPDPAEAT